MRALRLVPALIAAAVALGAVPAAAAPPAPPAPAGPGGRTPSVAARRNGVPRPTGRVEVKFKAGVGAKGRDAAYARVVAKGHRVRVDRTIPALNAAVLSVDSVAAVHRLLRADAAVELVAPEARYQAFAADPHTPELVEVGADTVHAGDPGNGVLPNTGAGTEIAVIDSPVDPANPDLDTAGKVTDAGDFSTPVTQQPDDPTVDLDCTPATCPHGTAVAVVAAGEGDTSVYGVAPAAKIRSYDVFRRFRYPCQDPADPETTVTCEESGASSGDIADALANVAAYAPSHPSLVAVNMSLGGQFDDPLIRLAIAQLHANAPRVTVVVAAGNDGRERADYPAGDPYVLSVGAIGQTQPYDANGNPVDCPASSANPWTVVDFSNRGDVDVVAPGRCVTSYYAPSNEFGEVNGAVQVTKVDGTSFAAPMVAGVAALVAATPNGATGDAARAAIMAGAFHTGTSVSTGLGRVRAPGAIDTANGPETYTAMAITRGGQVATGVGRRALEALRVNPAGTAPAAAAITAPPAGYGTVTGAASTSAGNVTRTTATYVAPPDNKANLGFTLRASGNGATTGPDHSGVPVKLLDAGDNYEGLPAASGEQTSVPLAYGTRSAYVRSAYVQGRLDFSWTFDPHGWLPPGFAQLAVWEPQSVGGSADAATEPVYYAGAESGADWVEPGVDVCDRTAGRECRPGRYLVGWFLTSANDDSSSTSRYQLKLGYLGTTATLSLPSVVSAVSASTPFRVAWGGSRAARWDVSYATKTKVGTSWVISKWTPWLTGTTLSTAAFGTSGKPLTPQPGYTYHFQVKAYDQFGNPSLPVVRSASEPLDDYSYHLGYSSGWARGPASGRWLSTLHWTTTRGATMTVSSETERFTLVGDRCNTCGGLRVYIDGVLKATVDTYASSTKVRQSLWTSPLLPGGPKAHTVKVVALGTSGRPRVTIDGVATQR
ncbi:MAG TPA: S8 family serine peptidase [Mycobacteriales bacterium]|jgi:hypothetical protein|nr:S8 family serine peptidase [Mycobacteriales bacterium]